MKYVIWFSLSFFIFAQLTGQWKPSSADLYEEAEDYFLFEEYKEALPLYMRINQADSLPAFIRYRVGICYLNMPGEEYRAVPFLEFAAKNISPELIKGSLTETKAPADALFFLGIAYRHINETGKAQTALKSFIEIAKNPALIERAERELDNTVTAELFRKNARQIEKTEVATAMGLTGEEFNLVISGDESTLAYAGSLKFYDAVFYLKLANQTWGQAKNMTPQLGSDGDTYPLSLSFDGNKMLLYRYDPGTNSDIYISRFENDRWTKMELLPSPINSEYYESHASLSYDENSIYFSSNRPGGYGGQDIYKAVKDENGKWGPAVNLGPQINTMGDEISPFISKDGKHLFFSSTGHTNMGGFDVFHSELLENGTWTEAYNLGYPINNSADNQFFIPVLDGREAYYEMMSAQQYKELVKVSNFMNLLHPLVNVAVHVSETYPGLSSTQPQLTLTDIRNGSILKTFEGIPQNGRFDLQLEPGYYELKLQNERYQPVASEFSIARYYPEPDMVISLELNPVPLKIELRHLYFAFDDFKLSEKEQQKLEGLLSLLNDYSGLELELRGFTDISGDRNYNKLLAGKRAGMVAEYLVSKGISLDRMKIIALGPENFIATNALIEGRRLNRRVEIHIKDLPGFVKLNDQDDIPEQLRFKKE
jgi:outer membrane protein OmpA-like peptidoglycan-associated protein